jgi:outer membrane receptor for ferric coprogen and ferric-rhodotorulic acid
MLRFTLARTRFALALASAVPGLCASSAWAEAQKQHYSVAAGSLVSALNRFAQQSGVFIAGHNDLAADKRSPGLNGDYTAQQALQILLKDSGLQAQQQRGGGYVLRSAATAEPLQLDATTINGKTLGAISEDTHAYTTGQTFSATGLALSLRETPQ